MPEIILDRWSLGDILGQALRESVMREENEFNENFRCCRISKVRVKPGVFFFAHKYWS